VNGEYSREVDVTGASAETGGGHESGAEDRAPERTDFDGGRAVNDPTMPGKDGVEVPLCLAEQQVQVLVDQGCEF
jgi:hypothetical protein